MIVSSKKQRPRSRTQLRCNLSPLFHGTPPPLSTVQHAPTVNLRFRFQASPELLIGGQIHTYFLSLIEDRTEKKHKLLCEG
ncbi:hypothetical protein V6N13_094538 [Hibiscus sabdariffa]|uniref:Uncharacterized protein n=1 Tax=Hibiscus sabdariffa TaxID=183260 RepID=A0ABR2PPT6_9ROSI